ncbi:hypothetical protein E1A91_D09G195400v1 [Gossypium mustelinum]|uniref:IREH1/IRE-like N-terminal domain-containing protein n=1 Tax=Gossypium mustelinum TaxID=34275 RepID=A0A5D2TP97_GOSMU|nr:hypothetical protein E1A91_D09G195400v1 [Gossypium mustelinum]
MVFKNKLFFSSKKSDSDGSNSPRSASNSPIRSDKKKPRAPTSQQASISTSTSLFSPVACKQTQVKDGPRSKDLKPRTPPSKPSSSSTSKKPDARDRSSSGSPLLASSLGLNRIKTRSGPLPQETFFSFRGEKNPVASVLEASNLSGPGGSSSGGDGSSSKSGSGKKDVLTKRLLQDSLLDNVSNSDSMSTGSGGGWHSREQSPGVQGKSRLQNGEPSSGAGQDESSLGHSGGLKSSDFCTPEISFDCENPKESESPRFQAILRVTSGPRKRFPADIKSFSHELNSKGVQPFPFWKPRRLNNLEETLVAIRAKFDKAKEEVNSDLAIFAADLVGVLERTADNHPEWQETIEDLLVLARSCAMTPPGEFWLQCEGIVQELDDERQELPACVLKQLYTRMLFILTRCTRLLQFQKESGLAEDEPLVQLRQSRVLHPVDNRKFSGVLREAKSLGSSKASKAASSKKSYSQEQHALDWSKDHIVLLGVWSLLLSRVFRSYKYLNFFPVHRSIAPIDDTPKNLESPVSIDKITSWKKLATPARKGPKEVTAIKAQHNSTSETLKRTGTSDVDLTSINLQELPAAKESEGQPSKHQHKVSSGSQGDQPTASEGSFIICRICEEEVPTSNVEDHSRICTATDRCDQNGLSVDERLVRIAETLEKMADSFANKDIQHLGGPDVAKASNSSVTEEFDVLSPKLSDWSRRGSEDMLDCFPEADNSVFMDDLKGLPSMSCKTRFGPKVDQGMTTSSAGSMTPRSPLSTPRTCQIDLLLSGKGAFSEQEDLPQVSLCQVIISE